MRLTHFLLPLVLLLSLSSCSLLARRGGELAESVAADLTAFREAQTESNIMLEEQLNNISQALDVSRIELDAKLAEGLLTTEEHATALVDAQEAAVRSAFLVRDEQAAKQKEALSLLGDGLSDNLKQFKDNLEGDFEEVKALVKAGGSTVGGLTGYGGLVDLLLGAGIGAGGLAMTRKKEPSTSG